MNVHACTSRANGKQVELLRFRLRLLYFHNTSFSLSFRWMLEFSCFRRYSSTEVGQSREPRGKWWLKRREGVFRSEKCDIHVLTLGVLFKQQKQKIQVLKTSYILSRKKRKIMQTKPKLQTTTVSSPCHSWLSSKNICSPTPSSAWLATNSTSSLYDGGAVRLPRLPVSMVSLSVIYLFTYPSAWRTKFALSAAFRPPSCSVHVKSPYQPNQTCS